MLHVEVRAFYGVGMPTTVLCWDTKCVAPIYSMAGILQLVPNSTRLFAHKAAGMRSSEGRRCRSTEIAELLSRPQGLNDRPLRVSSHPYWLSDRLSDRQPRWQTD